MKEQNSNLSTYAERLLKKVMDNSEANDWDSAVLEWDITAWDEDEELETSCLCGKENLRYLFTITNKENGNELVPIGSQCIKKFERDDLNEKTTIFEDLFKLQAAVKNGEFITLTSNYFSKKLLKYFLDEGVFSDVNGIYNPEKQYEFMLKMFNKRKKENITEPQLKKIRAIIFKQIIPFVKNILS